MIRFRRKSTSTRKLPAGVQVRLAGAALRAAHTAAKSGKCAAAELLFAFGNVDLQGAAAGTRSKGAALKTLDAGIEGADAARAIVECWERERG